MVLVNYEELSYFRVQLQPKSSPLGIPVVRCEVGHGFRFRRLLSSSSLSSPFSHYILTNIQFLLSFAIVVHSFPTLFHVSFNAVLPSQSRSSSPPFLSIFWTLFPRFSSPILSQCTLQHTSHQFLLKSSIHSRVSPNSGCPPVIPMGETSLDAMSMADVGGVVLCLFKHRDQFLRKTLTISGDKVTIKEMAASLTKHIPPFRFTDKQVRANGVQLLLFVLKRRYSKALSCFLFSPFLSWRFAMYNAMQCNAMQCNAMQCNAMQCNAMQCNAMQCNAMQCNAMQCNAMQCNAMQCNAMQCNAMQCNAMQCNAMQCNAMQCNAMQCNAMQCNAMQCNAMQCNAMQCNAMQCNAMQCNAMQCNAMQCNAMQCNAMQYYEKQYNTTLLSRTWKFILQRSS